MGSEKRLIPLSALYCLTLGGLLLAVIWGSRAVTVISESLPVSRGPCIIIDAGHGGVDGGATSCAGILESRYNLEISLKLNDLLHFLGYETRMIRTTDISVYTEGDTIGQKKISDLKQRLRIASETENALYVSIHQNQFPDSRYSGAQVFYPNTPDSQLLARQLQENLISCLNPGSNRAIKQAKGVYLMERIPCTGILIECGFLSNPEEEAKLRSSEYQQQLCCVIAATLVQYCSNAAHT